MSDESFIARHLGELIALISMILGGIWAAIRLVCGRHIKRLDNLDSRVDELEKTTINRTEHEAMASEFRREMRQSTAQINKRLDDILLAVTGKN